MSSIGAVGSGTQIQFSTGAKPERPAGPPPRQHAGPPPGSSKMLEEDLTTFLESEDVSSEEQTSILQDLKDTLQASLSSGSKPDFGKLKDTLTEVLKKHGVDATSFVSSLPTPPTGAGGPPSALGTGTTSLSGNGIPSLSGVSAASNSSAKSSSNGNAKSDSVDMLLKMLFEEVKNKQQSAAQTQEAQYESTATIDSSLITNQQAAANVTSGQLSE